MISSKFFGNKIRNGQKAAQELSVRLARAAFSSAQRCIDVQTPTSWEFSGFSQSGEDGITTFLLSRLKEKNRYFVDIGASNGFENNTALLAFGLKYSGLMIEGSEKLVSYAQMNLQAYNWGVRYCCIFVCKHNVNTIIEAALFQDPDLLSLDIDGNDYHILSEILDAGMRPKILVVEYNSAFGPENAVTIPYQEDFSYQQAHSSECYFGASIMAWRGLLERRGYTFVTVESNGVNAFFVDEMCFDIEFVRSLKRLQYAENFAHRRMYGVGWENHFRLISNMPLKQLYTDMTAAINRGSTRHDIRDHSYTQ